jgi:AraC-like DNA-binding protein
LKNEQYAILKKLQSLLEANPRASLSQACRELKVDRQFLEETLRNRQGKSYREYRRDLLLSQSVVLLITEPGLTISEIAGFLGYRHPGSFSRFIKDATGRSPSHLRKSLVRLRTEVSSEF